MNTFYKLILYVRMEQRVPVVDNNKGLGLISVNQKVIKKIVFTYKEKVL